ncbi:helix-turn-helix domain-containing protein [Nocardioides sp. AN3]
MTVGDVRHEPRECAAALARAFGFLGKRWNGVLISVLLGGPAGYAEIKRAVPGISDSMLSERLSELTRAGLFERNVDAGPPVSVTYQLTASGQALAPAFAAITTWAEENLAGGECSEEH